MMNKKIKYAKLRPGATRSPVDNSVDKIVTQLLHNQGVASPSMSVPYGKLCPERQAIMIICSMCEDVLYTDTMPEGLDEIAKVVCAICAFDYTMEGIG